MTEQERIEKNLRIKEAISATRAKRASQSCRVVTVKIQKNKLNKVQEEFLKMCFVEAKWLYNHILRLSNDGSSVFKLKYNDIETVIHLDKDKNEIESRIEKLSSQMKQNVLQGVQQNIKNLSASKVKGNRVGSLRFISDYNSIDLKQHDVSYKIVSQGKVKVQGCKKPLKVNGLKQLKAYGDYELANAKLIKKTSGYYIAFTIYTEKKESIHSKKKVGIDMGCQTSITMSDGSKINCLVGESERLKRLQRKLEKSKKGSNNRWKIRKLIQLEYERMSNRKDDAAHKICHYLGDYQVYMQDEQLSLWKIRHGKKVHHSVLGRVKEWLVAQDDTVVLNKFVPTSKFCRHCGWIRHDLTVKDRVFICPHCGHEGDRDVHAAENMLWIAENIVGVGRTDFKRVEFDAQVSDIMKHEAAKSLV